MGGAAGACTGGGSSTGGGSAQRAWVCSAPCSAVCKAWSSAAVDAPSMRDSRSACAVAQPARSTSRSSLSPGSAIARCTSANAAFASSAQRCTCCSCSPRSRTESFKRSRHVANSLRCRGSSVSAFRTCQARSSATKRFAGIGVSALKARAASMMICACARDSRCATAASRRCLAARCTRRSWLRNSRSACFSASSPASAWTAESLISTSGVSCATRSSAASSPSAAWRRGAHATRASSASLAFMSARACSLSWACACAAAAASWRLMAGDCLGAVGAEGFLK